MPIENIVLILLIGIVFGVIAGVLMRSRGAVFVLNLLFGIIGAALGAFFPFLVGQASTLSSGFDFLIRAMFGAFILVLIASLFRSAKPPGIQ